MPVMSALELQARVADDGHGIPFAFVTAFPDDQIRPRALQGGAGCGRLEPAIASRAPETDYLHEEISP